MPCYKPLKAFRDSDGIRFVASKTLSNLLIACGQCIGCRLERSRQWAVRCMHEASMHKHNCFITLTYAPEHLPPNGSLVKQHHQKFLKRLRKALSKRGGGRTRTFTIPHHRRKRGRYGAPPHTPA